MSRLFCILTFFFTSNVLAQYNNFNVGEIWKDTDGKIINAHGGGILYNNGKYYWIGEKRDKHQSLGVNIYSSKDLYNWKFEKLALTPEYKDTLSDIAFGCLMERPKVIYNKKTGKYVMWFHLELRNKGYSAAKTGVAISNNITGPYKYLYSLRPNGNMSRDMTLFVDNDEKAYLIYSSRENYDLRAVQLTDDYLLPTKKDSLLFSQHREAPAIFKKENTYFMITSGCTGWEPNKAILYVSNAILGQWKQIADNPMRGKDADKTFGAQSTYVFPVINKENNFIFMADKWNPKNLIDSRYIWLPVKFENNFPKVDWKENWNLNFFDNKLK